MYMDTSKAFILLVYFFAITISASCQSQVAQTYESEKLAYTLEPVVTNMEIPWAWRFCRMGVCWSQKKKVN